MGTVSIDGGKRRAFLKEDNSFVIQGMLPGSYLVEVDTPEYVYEAVRIDINSKGKHRARKNNPVQPNQVTQLPYPLKCKPLGKYRYYEKREEWKITDVLFNPNDDDGHAIVVSDSASKDDAGPRN